MSIREIKYTVKADGIDPAVKQFGGVQGDHRVSEVVFNIDSKLYESLEAVALDKSGQLIYRIDGYNGAGEVIRSDTNKLSSDKVGYLLEETITRYGGLIRVVLVISLMANDLTEMELYSFPVVLQLKNLPTGAETDEKNRESMSVLAQVAKEASAVASAAAKEAAEAKDKTELAKAALEGGAEWVFDGGSPTDDVNINFVIDSQMSGSSENAVMNKVAKAYVDGEFEKFSELLENAIKEAKLEAHPIGSYYWSSEATEPSELFGGGTWERVEGKFILAAGRYIDKNGTDRTYSVNDEDFGEYLHTLSIEEMPSHKHALTQSYCAFAAGGDMSATSGYQGATSYHTAEEGGGQPHNNMPPYEVAYCWKRTA